MRSIPAQHGSGFSIKPKSALKPSFCHKSRPTTGSRLNPVKDWSIAELYEQADYSRKVGGPVTVETELCLPSPEYKAIHIHWFAYTENALHINEGFTVVIWVCVF
jgi:hypothetical protein